MVSRNASMRQAPIAPAGTMAEQIRAAGAIESALIADGGDYVLSSSDAGPVMAILADLSDRLTL